MFLDAAGIREMGKYEPWSRVGLYRFLSEIGFEKGEFWIDRRAKLALKYVGDEMIRVNGLTHGVLDDLASDPYVAYTFARTYLVNRRFNRGEKTIALDPYYAFTYARDVLKGRFEKGEEAIAGDPYCAFKYAKTVLGGKFALGEKVILESEYGDLYREMIAGDKGMSADKA